MGNSNITLASVFDWLAARGVPDPRGGPSGYGDRQAIIIANQIMADLVCERFPWKWNRATAAPFYTNSYQQDYMQPAQAAGPIGWGEDGDVIDINSTSVPPQLKNIKWRRGLSRTNTSRWWPENFCWMYNGELSLGVWPGADVTYYPLLGAGAPMSQNPIMSMKDANGNILIVTVFGTTGSVAPVLPANSVEGTTVVDGTVTWTCVSATSQGFRLDCLPSAAGPTLQIIPYYQLEPPTFTVMSQKINPVPDNFSRFFFRGAQSECLMASVNPGDMKRGEQMKAEWLNALALAIKQGDRELDSYALQPVTGPVEPYYGPRQPRTPDNPYGWNY